MFLKFSFVSQIKFNFLQIMFNWREIYSENIDKSHFCQLIFFPLQIQHNFFSYLSLSNIYVVNKNHVNWIHMSKYMSYIYSQNQKNLRIGDFEV
jgi:hypothetical protein